MRESRLDILSACSSSIANIPSSMRRVYQGLMARRVLAVEVMLGTPALRNLIREGKTHQLYSTMQLSLVQGMQTLDQSLVNLYHKGLINEEGALSVCQNTEQVIKDIKTIRPLSIAANLK